MTNRSIAPQRPAGAGWLDDIYELPDVLRSWEDLQRARHADLPALGDDELRREQRRIDLRLVIEDEPSPWLAERLRAIGEELHRRRRVAPPAPSPPQQPPGAAPALGLHYRPAGVRHRSGGR